MIKVQNNIDGTTVQTSLKHKDSSPWGSCIEQREDESCVLLKSACVILEYT